MMKPMEYFKKSLKLCFLLLLCTMLLPACEYDSDDDNFHELQKPTEQVEIGVDLAGVNPKETIYLYENSFLYYTLHTGGKEVVAQKFYLDGKEISLAPGDRGVYLHATADNSIHDLKLVMGLPTGSGSLAEYAGYEMYVGEFNFKVRFVPVSTISLNIRQTLDEQNHLKLVWDKPEGYEVESYYVYNGDVGYPKPKAIITNPDQTYYVDKNYAYGYKFYIIIAKLKNGNEVVIREDFLVRYTNVNQDNFEIERISPDKFKIKWTNPNPFPCKYVFRSLYDNKVTVLEGATELVIPAEIFPSISYNFHLYILPAEANSSQYESYGLVWGSFGDKKVGYNFSYVADPVNSMLLGLDYTNLFRYDLSKMDLQGVIKHNLILHSGCKVKTSNKGLVAIDDHNGTVRVYSNSTLTNQLAAVNTAGFDFYLTDADQLLATSYDGFSLYDVHTSNLICSKKWNTTDEWTSMVKVFTRISVDGKYIYTVRANYSSNAQIAELYQLTEADTLRLVRSQDAVNITNIEFNPVKANEVVIQYSDFRFAILDVITGDTVTGYGTFLNIDALTGNLMYYGADIQNGQSNIYVWDTAYKKVLYKFTTAYSDIYARLYNNQLLFNGYCVDLSKMTYQ